MNYKGTQDRYPAVSTWFPRRYRARASNRSSTAHITRVGSIGLTACLMATLASGHAWAQDAAKPADPPVASASAQAPAAPAAPAAAQAPAASAQAPAAPAAAAPAAPAAPAPGSVSYSGLLDFYLGINMRAPSPAFLLPTVGGGPIGIDNVGRSFDINDRIPSFSLGEFNITRTEGKGIPFGITATLTFGDTARIVHANEPGGTSSWQTLQQLYVTKTITKFKHDFTFDFGKFVTPFGYEVIESVNNDEYSRSFGFQYGIPLYHAGLRVNVPLNPMVSLYGAIVNGWNDTADDNNAKSGIFQATWKPNAKFTGILGYMGGSEGTGAYGVPVNTGYIDTNLFEIQPVYQFNANFKVAADLVYGQGAGTINGVGHASGYWTSMAGYTRYQITPRLAVAGRVEQFEDIGGLRLGAPYTKLDELTLTLEYQFFRSHLVTRLEYRHDHANQTFFLAGNGARTPDQDTLYASGVIKF